MGVTLGLGAGRAGGAEGVVVLAAELFKSLAGRLGDEERGEAAEEHEEGVDLEHVVHPGGRVVSRGAASAERGDGALADDGSDLARGGRDTMGRGAVAGREDFTGDDEGGGVGAWSRVSNLSEKGAEIWIYIPKLKKN